MTVMMVPILTMVLTIIGSGTYLICCISTQINGIPEGPFGTMLISTSMDISFLKSIAHGKVQNAPKHSNKDSRKRFPESTIIMKDGIDTF